MTFTALHRALGERPGPFTDEMIDAAIAEGVRESAEIDWKSELPPVKALRTGEFPKDVAAMANGPGGVLVYGVKGVGKAAGRRVGTADLTEEYERAMFQAVFNRIEPPVFGLKVHAVGVGGRHVVVVEVPSSPDSPHLIARDSDYFGAPLRNDADTVWMRERQLEQAYRARFEERRRVTESLLALHAEAEESHPRDGNRSWFVGVARPQSPRTRETFDKSEVQDILLLAAERTKAYAGYGGDHPITQVNRTDLRPGLRRWVAPSAASPKAWPSHREAWISIHHDGSVSVVAAVGARPPTQPRVDAAVIECAVADLMAVVRETAAASSDIAYDVRIGMSWSSGDALTIIGRNRGNRPDDSMSTPVLRFIPVEASVAVGSTDVDYLEFARQLALDCVNQGGVHALCAMKALRR